MNPRLRVIQQHTTQWITNKVSARTWKCWRYFTVNELKPVMHQKRKASSVHTHNVWQHSHFKNRKTKSMNPMLGLEGSRFVSAAIDLLEVDAMQPLRTSNLASTLSCKGTRHIWFGPPLIQHQPTSKPVKSTEEQPQTVEWVFFSVFRR